MPGTPDPALLEQLRNALAGSYEIERELSGGMSRVFVATERALGRRVVIKVLPPELTAGVNRDRFRREIQFAARLQHPHIVPLLTAGQIGDILYYTMPLVEGETLRARLDRERRLPAAVVVGILQDVVDALAYAHSQGLIHRDIKPENILLQRHHALVTDFGVAKAISEALPGTAATTVGVAVGTPAYMAPEQLAADPAADHRIDLYAVGLVAYELLSGESPFSGSSPQQTLARQLTERPTPPHIQRTDVPPALSSVIMRCLEKDPGARYGSADELLAAVAEIRITSSGMPALARTRRITPARPGRKPLLAGISAVALIGVLVAAGYALWSPRSPAPATSAKIASAPAESAASEPPAPRPGLTRADSEAIAASVARQMPQRHATPSTGLTQAGLDSLRAEVAKTVTDSLVHLLSSARTAPRAEDRGGSGIPLPGLGEFPSAPTALRMFSGRHPFRVAVVGVVDRTQDRSQGALAQALKDPLSRFVARRRPMLLLPDDTVRAAAALARDPRELGPLLKADAVVNGVIQSTVGDSIEVIFRLAEGRGPGYSKSLRHSVPRSEAGAMATIITPMVTAWLNSQEARSRTLTIPRGLSVDSAVRAAMRWRDSVRKRPPSP